MSLKFSFSVEGEEVLFKRLNAVSDTAQDLSAAFEAVHTDWWQPKMTEVFENEGTTTNKWKELSPKYAEYKAKRYPFVGLFINRRTDRLRRSLVFQTDDSVRDIGKRNATFGTTVPYAKAVHSVRPIIEIDEKDGKKVLSIIKKSLTGSIRRETGGAFIMTESNYLDF